MTFVDAELTDNDGNTNIGNVPRRQPGLTYNFLPSYSFKGGHSISVSIIGQTESFAQDNNELVMPGFTFVNTVASARIAKNTNLNLSVNNVFNTIGITESEEGSITEGQTNYVRARSISGRTILAGVSLNF